MLKALLSIRLNSLVLLIEKVNPAMPCVVQGSSRLKNRSFSVLRFPLLHVKGRMMK